MQLVDAIDWAGLQPVFLVRNFTLYILHDHSLETQQTLEHSPDPPHLRPSTWQPFKENMKMAEKKNTLCQDSNLIWRPISIFLNEMNRAYGSAAIFYKAACVSICVAGMTSVSLCWDRKILAHCHYHKSNTIMKWHHSGSVIKWADCCLGVLLGWAIESHTVVSRRKGCQ